jgi:hypothetical protein
MATPGCHEIAENARTALEELVERAVPDAKVSLDQCNAVVQEHELVKTYALKLYARSNEFEKAHPGQPAAVISLVTKLELAKMRATKSLVRPMVRRLSC